MWNKLSPQWQRVFFEAWEAYKAGSFPIGAVVTDKNGNIVSTGRNLVFDENSSSDIAGSYIAHAEIVALMRLKESSHPKIKEYTLYSSMEPCPMCCGAIAMIHIRKLQYAAKDGLAGSTEIFGKTEYLRSKDMNIKYAGKDLEVFQIALQTAFECSREHPKMNLMLDKWSQYCDAGVAAGKRLQDTNFFADGVKNNLGIEDVYNAVMRVVEGE